MTRRNLLDEIVAYLSRFMVFSNPDYARVCAMYAAATHLWQHFDSFPYLHVTADTKRAGKTRLSELLGFLVLNPRRVSGATPATIFRMISDDSPTLIMDEIESLGSEAKSVMRAILNVGYRRGQTIPRTVKDRVVQFDAYCPKVFVGIGDVYDTLMDRSIVVRLTRGVPAERFTFQTAEADGVTLKERIAAACKDRQVEILDTYYKMEADYVSDRDEELWLPLLAVCSVLAPEWMADAGRIVADIAAAKTAETRNASYLANAEDAAADAEYSVRLLRDLAQVIGRRSFVPSMMVLEELKAIPTSPWRKYRGEGLTVRHMGQLLSVFGVRSRNIKLTRGVGAGRGKVGKGFKRDEVERAIKSLG